MLETDLLIKYAILEDMPKGDITTDALDLGARTGRASLIAKEDFVLSGIELFAKTFQQIDSTVEIQWLHAEGDYIMRGQKFCLIKGALASILKSERVALNFLGRMSGIATLTRCFVQEVAHTTCKILDTRKTTPLLRHHERAAVRHGGGHNHRMNLSDKVLIKENHIRAYGPIEKTIEAVRVKARQDIEVEVRNLEELKAALKAKPDVVMFDNMSNEDMRDALQIIPATTKTEASGNMSIDRVRAVAELGVDSISVGLLTHSAPSADISMLFEDYGRTS